MTAELEKMSKQDLLRLVLELQNNSDQSSDANDQNQILHELQVHQIELEMQNRELRETQQQLEETRDNYADLYDFSPVSYITFDAKGIIKNINLTASLVLGDVRSNLLDKSLSKWLDSKDFFILTNHIKKTLSDDVAVVDELRIKRKNEYMDIRIESIRSNYQLKDSYCCRSVLLNITQEKSIREQLISSKRRLDLIADSLPVLIAYLNKNEKHLFVNKLYSETFSAAAESIINEYAIMVWGKTVYKQIISYLHCAYAGEKISFTLKIPDSKNLKYYQVILIPDIDTSHIVKGVSILMTDISGQLESEASDRKKLLEMSHISRLNSMGQMASEIAHELNQSLAAISLYSDASRRMVLADNFTSGELLESLNKINIQSQRAGDTIKRIREFVSKKEMQCVDSNINEVIESAMQLLDIEIHSHNVELELILDSNLPNIPLDKILIEQVLFNLCRNSLEVLDNMDYSARLLSISTLRNDDDIEITVSDTGPGIDSVDLLKIFEPFYSTKKNNMGMGLAICHSIIHAHNGKIWAETNDDRGVKIKFTLPIKQEGINNES